MLVKMGSSSPIFRGEHQKIFETTTCLLQMEVHEVPGTVVGDPYKPSFATVTGRGDNLWHMAYLAKLEYFTNLDFPEITEVPFPFISPTPGTFPLRNFITIWGSNSHSCIRLMRSELHKNSR